MSETSAPIRIERSDKIAWVTLDAPPMNLLGANLMGALFGLVDAMEKDEDSRVMVLRSADPDFWVAHGDVESITQVPTDPAPEAVELPMTHLLMERLRKLPQVTIAQIEGYARGGGSELALACDMRFATLDKAVFGQPEIALGILPGAGGTARLTRLLGRARASEIILGGDDFSAAEAERYGWINRALPADEVGPFVERLARRIATFPRTALIAAKQTVQTISDRDMEADLLLEQRAFDALMSDPTSERVPRMERFLAKGIQTREGETGLANACERLGDRDPA
ncbi:MAG: enoyl-CoA hydratase/isomerase family protein [Myxococcota bacterium]